MYPPQTGQKEPTSKVKNTFLEFAVPEDADSSGKRRTRSDGSDVKRSPLVVASKSPIGSPLLQPVDETLQALPIEEVNFELLEEAEPFEGEPSAASRNRYPEGAEAVAQAAAGIGRDEPAYVMPTTPSPFLHSAFPPSVVPPFCAYGYAMPDMGLPPAYGEGDSAPGGDGSYGVQGNEMMQDVDGQYMQDADGQYMQGMQYLPEMYDPNFSAYMQYGWAVPVEQDAPYGQTGAQPPGDHSIGSSTGGGPCELPEPGPGALDVLAPGSPRDQAVEPACAEEPREAQDRASVPKESGRRGKGRREAREEERADRRTATAAAGGGSASGKGGGKNADGGGGSRAADTKDSDPDKPPNGYTTVMLRNIPNKYTREMLIKQLCIDYHGQFDFMYLPIDFKNKCNVGYGFINFRTPEACDKFMTQFHKVDVRKCLPGLNSKKVVEVTPARVQGLTENVRRLRNSPVMNQLQDHPEWMPLLFNEYGEEEPFPNPDQPLPPVKPRGRNREAHAAAALGDT